MDDKPKDNDRETTVQMRDKNKLLLFAFDSA